jgi:hypothetical protein
MIAEKKKPNRPSRSEEVGEELVRELKHLRVLVRDAGESFILRREGEIETIISHLAAVPRSPLKTELPGWLQEIRELKLKPAKGRLKDLKEIDALIEKLTDQVMSAQDDKKRHGKNQKA